jgi:hypothetical protein
VTEKNDIDFPLRRGMSAIGRVVGVDDAPVVGASVAIEGQRFDGPTQQISCGRATTDADGRFRVADLDGTMPLVLTAFAPGHARARQTLKPSRAEPIDVGDVHLVAPRAIEGRALNVDGSPATGVDVRLVGPDVTAREPGSREERRTDDLGRFRFGDLGPGAYSVEMQVAGGPPVVANVTLPADRDVLDVALSQAPTGASLAVVVKDDLGAPVADMGVGGQDESGAVVQRKTDAAGRAVLDPARGRITKVYVGGYSEGFLSVKPVDVEAGRRELVVTVERGTQMKCRVVDADGAPLARATVAVEPADRCVVYSTPLADSCVTDPEGRICVTLARRGDFTFVCHGVVYDENRRKLDSLLEAREEHVTAQSGEIVLRCRPVETGRTAVVRVLGADGSPAIGVEITLTSHAAAQRKATTDAEGRARFDGLPAREFQPALPYKPNTLSPVLPKFVPQGQEVVLKIPSAVTLTGVAVWSSGEPASDASVSVRRGDVMVFFTSADRDGRFTVQLPADDAGSFRLTVAGMSGKATVTAESDVGIGDRDLRVALKR